MRTAYATLAQQGYFGARSVRAAAGMKVRQEPPAVVPTTGEVQWREESMPRTGLFARGKEAPGIVFGDGVRVGRFLRSDVEDFIAGQVWIAESMVKQETAFIAPVGAAAPTSVVADLTNGLAADTVVIVKVEDKEAHLVAAADMEAWGRFVQAYTSA